MPKRILRRPSMGYVQGQELQIMFNEIVRGYHLLIQRNAPDIAFGDLRKVPVFHGDYFLSFSAYYNIMLYDACIMHILGYSY